MPTPLPVLDWRSRHHPGSRNYGVSDALPRTIARTDKQWVPGAVLDQGREGACVGFAWTSEALAYPVAVQLDRLRIYAPTEPNAFARFIYRTAQHIDEYQGEQYDGTSVLAGAQAMWNMGLLTEYRWAFNIEEVIDAVLTIGPVIVGISWYSGMYNPVGGVLRKSGTLVGGHALTITGYTASSTRAPGEETLTVKNSWGTGWGRAGFAEITKGDLAALLADQGEACVPVRRSFGRS